MTRIPCRLKCLKSLDSLLLFFVYFFTMLFVALVVIKLNIVENNWNNIPLIYNTIFLYYLFRVISLHSCLKYL